MTKIMDDILKARRVCVPVVGCSSADQLALTQTIREASNGSVPLLRHDVVRGCEALNEPGAEALAVMLGGHEQSETVSPIGCLALAEKLPSKAILIAQNCHRWIGDNGVSQAILNLRDIFKSDQRMLILLAPDFSLPVELVQDVILLDDPLPTREQISEIVKSIGTAASLELPESTINDASEALVGLAAFPAEQSAAMALSKTGLSVDECWQRKRKQVEQTKGLSMSDASVRYADIGGLDAIKDKFSRIFSGPAAPRLIVQFEEIEKLLAGASGPVGDSSGTSQDQLQVLLDTIESNGWLGALFLGPPGSGKSYFSSALAGQFNVKRVLFDLGAMKGSLVGESEGRVRAAMRMVKAIGGDRVLVCGTCNKMESLPPELRRRFNSCGMWFFDLPDNNEKMSIWDLQMKRYSIQSQLWPNCVGWSAANIRDCCRSAYICGESLEDSARSIVSATAQDPEGIERLRRLAAGRFLSASYPGAYKYQSTQALPVSGKRGAMSMEEL